jgi:hypothetical protein
MKKVTSVPVAEKLQIISRAANTKFVQLLAVSVTAGQRIQ